MYTVWVHFGKRNCPYPDAKSYLSCALNTVVQATHAQPENEFERLGKTLGLIK